MVATPSRSATPIGGTHTHDGLEPRSEVVLAGIPRRSGNGGDRQRARPEKALRALDSALLDEPRRRRSQLRAEVMGEAGRGQMTAAFIPDDLRFNGRQDVPVLGEEYVRTLTPGDPLENDALNPIVYAVGAG
jgi:hypothetical protein